MSFNTALSKQLLCLGPATMKFKVPSTLLDIRTPCTIATIGCFEKQSSSLLFTEERILGLIALKKKKKKIVHLFHHFRANDSY